MTDQQQINDAEHRIIASIQTRPIMSHATNWRREAEDFAREAFDMIFNATSHHIGPTLAQLKPNLQTPYGQAMLTIDRVLKKYDATESAKTRINPLDIAALRFFKALKNNSQVKTAFETIMLQRGRMLEKGNSIIPNLNQAHAAKRMIRVNRKDIIQPSPTATIRANSEDLIKTLGDKHRHLRHQMAGEGADQIIMRALCLAIEYPEEQASNRFISAFTTQIAPSKMRALFGGGVSAEYSDLQGAFKQIKTAYETIRTALENCAPDQNADALLQHIIIHTGYTHSFLCDADWDRLEATTSNINSKINKPTGEATPTPENIFDPETLKALKQNGLITETKQQVASFIRSDEKENFDPKLSVTDAGTVNTVIVRHGEANKILLNTLANAAKEEPNADWINAASYYNGFDKNTWVKTVERLKQKIFEIAKDHEHNQSRNETIKEEMIKACTALFQEARQHRENCHRLSAALNRLNPEPSLKADTPAISVTDAPPQPLSDTELDNTAVTAGGRDEIDWTGAVTTEERAAARERSDTEATFNRPGDRVLDTGPTNFHELPIGDRRLG